LQRSDLAGPLALDAKRRPWHGIQATVADVTTAIRARAERPLLNSAKPHYNPAYDGRLVTQAYDRQVPVQFVLRLLKAVSAS
jgi:hypothetical protein